DREQAILTFLLENAEDAHDLRISKVADHFDVSESMIVKLAKRVGFSGFRELKAHLTDYSTSSVGTLYEEVTPSDDAAAIVRKLFRASMQALEETLAIFNLEHFERAADLYHRAKIRDIYGSGGSAAIARDAAHKFLRIGMRCACYEDAHLMAMSAATLTPHDVVFAISHSGQSAVVLDAVRIAKSRDVPVIALTSYQNSRIAQYADAALVSTARSSPFTGENAAARIAQLNLIDALFVRVAFMNREAAEKNLSQTMAAVEAKRE
ncbi:MAG: SIS domain-containing protein, partial [Spirochaetales bacterium]|nr:SIS domain-containing protein [Spirochaetales bacterium]